jgi:hypothetical protein
MIDGKRKVEMRQSVSSLRPGDYPLGSPQSRAAARLRLQEATGLGRGAEECICFLRGEVLKFRNDAERAIAAKLQCPLHGRRFPTPAYRIFEARWVYKRWLEFYFPKSSAQFKKAWYATFPPDLWPADIVQVNGKWMLRLKDGTLLDPPDDGLGLNGSST